MNEITNEDLYKHINDEGEVALLDPDFDTFTDRENSFFWSQFHERGSFKVDLTYYS